MGCMWPVASDVGVSWMGLKMSACTSSTSKREVTGWQQVAWHKVKVKVTNKQQTPGGGTRA